MSGLRWAVALILFLGLTAGAWAGPVEESGKLFALGRSAEAAALLDRVVRTNSHSADLWFNLGQARFQAGEPGKAVAAWRRAHRLDPRDGAVRTALAQVRQRVGTEGTHPLALMSGWLREEEWAVLVLVGSAGLLVVGVLRRVRPGTGLALLLGAVVVQSVALTGWGAATVGRRVSPNAVVIERDVSAVQAPVVEARKIRPLAEGVEVRVLRFHGDWAEVSLDGVRAGWIPKVALAMD